MWGRASWMREALAAGGGLAPIQYAHWTNALVNQRNFLLETQAAMAPPRGGWPGYVSAFDRAERELHWGTAGWVHADFYRIVDEFLDRAGAPAEARAAVELAHGAGSWDWEEAASAADVLVGRIAAGERWVRPTVLLDAAVVAYLKTDRPQAARTAYRLLVARTERAPRNLRNRLLDALIREAEDAAGR